MTDDPSETQRAVSAEEKFELCQARIGYRFTDIELLRSALTHASGASKRVDSNERLEFLGDSILGLIVCEHLFRLYPNYLEGELTKIKSIVVSRRVCAKVSKHLGLEECLIVGKGLMGTGVPRSLLSDVFESIIAAVYLDSGIESARKLIDFCMATEIQAAVQGFTGGNYKSILQHLVQREKGGSPVYLMISEQGPDHSKTFQMAASVAGTRFTPAWGRNKKDAEQRAAGNALAELRGEAPPYAAAF
ncbi:MAG: ribonuclease III [Pirellulaceae bacterium]|nr:ribonuclease III [Pirellulaceae bacterium]